MSFPQLGYQYIRPIYPAERPGSGGSRGGAELAPSGTLSNVLSSMYGAPYAAAAAAQGYGAFLPYAAELPIFPQLVRGPPRGSPLAARDARAGAGPGAVRAGDRPGGPPGKTPGGLSGEPGRYRCPARGVPLERRPRGFPPPSARRADGARLRRPAPAAGGPAAHTRTWGAGPPSRTPRGTQPARPGLPRPERGRGGAAGAGELRGAGRRLGPAAALVPSGLRSR